MSSSEQLQEFILSFIRIYNTTLEEAKHDNGLINLITCNYIVKYPDYVTSRNDLLKRVTNELLQMNN